MGLFDTLKNKLAKSIQCSTAGQDNKQNSALQQIQNISQSEEEQDQSDMYNEKPPKFEELLASVKMITKNLGSIKGFNFDVIGMLSNQFQVGQSIFIPTSTNKPQQNAVPMPLQQGKPADGHYTLTTQFVGVDTAAVPQQELASYILTGRMLSTGSLEGAIIKQINQNITVKMAMQFQNSDVNFAQSSLDLEYEGQDYKNNFKMGTGFFSWNLMQKIGKQICLGFEYMHVGYMQKFTNTGIVSTINSQGKINTIFTLFGNAFSLKLCASANYLKDSYKFGYGISVGQTQ